MRYLLNPRMWIATAVFAALVATHFAAYRTGRGHVRAAWDKEKVVQLEAARQQEAAFRAKEQQLIAAKQQSEAKYVELKKRFERNAADARAELDGLRNDLAALGNAAAEGSASGPRVDGGAGLERQLLGACAETLVRLASEADGLEARLVGLQGYVKQVCLKQ